jgi:hypothetical protein
MFNWLKNIITHEIDSANERREENKKIIAFFPERFKHWGSGSVSDTRTIEKCAQYREEYRAKQKEIAVEKAREIAEMKEFNAKISKIFLRRVCYIDSNIFMSENNVIELLFDVISNKELVLADDNIVVIKEQYNELYKLKSSNQNDVSYKARLAFRRIEALYSEKILKINSLDADLKGESYADVAFVKEIVMQLKKGLLISFITEDLDLKIRLNLQVSSLGDIEQKNLKIYSLKDLEV